MKCSPNVVVNLLITCEYRGVKATFLQHNMKNKHRTSLNFSTMLKRLCLAFLVLGHSFYSTSQSLKTVVIDPGHGGADPGAIGPTKKYEKDVVLAVSLYLGEMIKKAYPDVKVIYTRETDKFVGLADRAEMANKLKADLFISIHANASSNSSAYGSESFVLGLHATSAALDVAKRENAVITLEEDHATKYESFDPNDPESYIWLSMRQNTFLNQSINLADNVQDEFTNKLKRFNRGVKQAGFLVLYRTTMPSILVEIGFISNPSEEKWMSNADGQQEIATSLFKAFSKYKNHVDGSSADNVSDNNSNADKEKKNNNDKENPDKNQQNNNNQTTQNDVPSSNEPVFSVQVMATPKKADLSKSPFTDYQDVIEYNAGGLYKYAIGKCKTYKEAVDLQSRLRKEGFDSAFVVAFLKGERIDLNKARELAKQ